MASLSERLIPERTMTSIDSAEEAQAIRIHERRTAEALRANEIAQQKSTKEIPQVEQRIKSGIADLLGNQDGQKRIVLSALEARRLLSHAIGSQAYEMEDGVEVLISRESPESRIVITPLNPRERKYTQILSVNGPMTASDLTLLARSEIRVNKPEGTKDALQDRLELLHGWERIVSSLAQGRPNVLTPAKQPPLAA